MTWNDFTRDEKRAIIKSAFQIASAYGNVSYSANQFLGLLLLQMHADDKLMKDAIGMWKFNMIRFLRGMNEAKKEIVREVWLKVMNRSTGGTCYGNTSVDKNTKEGAIVYKLGSECNIEISGSYLVDAY